MRAYSVPCWLVGWWLWRAGCISQDTYLLYTLDTLRKQYVIHTLDTIPHTFYTIPLRTGACLTIYTLDKVPWTVECVKINGCIKDSIHLLSVIRYHEDLINFIPMRVILTNPCTWYNALRSWFTCYNWQDTLRNFIRMLRYLEELIHFIVLLSLMPLAEEDVEMGIQIRQFIGFPKTRKKSSCS